MVRDPISQIVAEFQVALTELLDDLLDQAYEIVRDQSLAALPPRECIAVGVMLDRHDRIRELIDPAYRETATALWDVMSQLSGFQYSLTLEREVRLRCPVSVRMSIETPKTYFTKLDRRFLRSLQISPL